MRNVKRLISKLHLALFAFLSLSFITSFAEVARADIGASVTVGSTGNIDPLENKDLIITLSNSDQATALTAVAFSNSLPGTLPDGLFVSGAPTYECTDPAGGATTPGVGTLSASGQSISLSGGVIPAASGGTSATCQITIPVTAGTSTGNAATYVYTVTDGSVSGNDGAGTLVNSGDVSQSIVVNPMVAPTITVHTIEGGSTLTLGGSDETLFFRVSNSNAFEITNFNFSNVFPLITGNPAFHVFSPPGVIASCTNGGAAPTLTPSAGDTSLSFSGTLPAASGGVDGSCSFRVQIEGLRTGGVYQTNVTNQILLSSWSSDIGIGLGSNPSRTITLLSPLSTSINFTNSELSTGQTDSMEIVFSNSANSAISISTFTDAQIDDLTAAGYGLTINGTPTVSCTGGGTDGAISVTGASEGFQWTGGVIAAGSICTITVNFTGTVQTAGVPIIYTNTINQGDVSAGAIAGEIIINEGANDSILVGDSIRVSIEANPTTAAAGNPIRYDVTVENFGSTALADVTILDVLPAGQSLLTGVIGGFDFTPSMTGCGGLTETNALGETSPTFTIGSLPARVDSNTTGSCVVTYWVQSDPAGGSGTNDIPASGVTIGGGGSNQVGSNSVTVTETPALAIVNSFSPSSTFEGTESLLTVTFSNWSAQALANLSFSYTLPVGSLGGQLFLASVPSASSTCAGAVITANPGDTTVSLSGAAVPGRASGGIGASGSCVLQFRVVGSAGVYNNTISATADATPANGGPAVSVAATSNAASLTYASALSASTTFTPTAIFIGGTAQAIIRLDNSGTGLLTGVSVTDALPAGMVLAAQPNAYTTCAGPSAITAVGGAGTITMTGATIAPTGSCDLIFDVTTTSGGPWINTIPTGGVTADGGVVNINPFSATLGLLPAQSLLVSEFTSPSTLSFPGEVSRLTIEITNGTNPVSNLSLTDFFTTDGLPGSADNNIIISGTPAGATTCTGGTVTATPGGNSVTLTGASMGASEVCQYSVNVTSIRAGGITNVIPIGTITTTEGYTNSNQATTSLTTQSNIGVTKQFDPQNVTAGERSRLIITLYNPGTSPLTSIAINDNFPVGLTIPSAANPTTTCSGGTISTAGANQISLSGGLLAASTGATPASCVLEVDVVAAVNGDFVNTINAGEVTGLSDGTPVGNISDATDTLRVKDALEVQISIDGETLDTVIQTGSGNVTGSVFTSAGMSETVTIRLRNTNDTALTDVSFIDLLPSGLVLATTPNGATTCVGGSVNAAASGTSIQLTGASIPTNDACTVTADVLSNIAGSYIDDIPAGAISTAEGVTNATETRAEITIAEPPTVDLVFSPPVIAPNGTSTVTITLGNPNAEEITLGSEFVYTLPIAPGSVLVDGTPGIVTDCPGTVTAVAGSATISYGSGDIIPAGGCTISVNVTGDTAGDYTGLIPTGDLSTNVGTNQTPATGNLTISGQGFISGQVWLDLDATTNGLFDNGTDTPLSGVTLELHNAADCTGTASQTAVTDGLGAYVFSSLTAGTYSVCQPDQPGGSLNGTTTAGSIVIVGGSTGTAGIASNPTATSSEIVNISLGASGGDISGSPDNNFAELPGASIDLAVTITQAPSSFSENSNQGTFIVTGSNTGSVDSSGIVTIVTTLPTGITPTGGTGTGWTCTVAGQEVTCTSTDVIAAGATAPPITIATLTGNGLPATGLTATSEISGGGEPVGVQGNNAGSVAVSVLASASVSGTVWQDLDHDRARDPGEPLVAGWIVELLDNTGTLVATATTDASGAYLLDNITPGSGYELRFREPGSGAIFGRPVPNESGTPFTNGAPNSASNPGGADNSGGTLTGLTLAAGTNTPQQSLPLDPAGIIYDSETRQPIEGAVVTITGPVGFVPADVVGGSTSVTTGADGLYQFLLNGTAPSGIYTLTVTGPGGYDPAPSTGIPACTNAITVAAAPDPALVQDVNAPPDAGSPIHDPATCPATSAGFNAGNQDTTQYYFDFNITIPTSANIVNNHIPLDPNLSGAIAMAKTTPRVDVTRGAVVPYTITARNARSNALTDIDLVDQMPPGFAYRTGTASINGVAVAPTISGRTLRWSAQDFAGGETKTIKLMLIVTAGVGIGEYVNEAWAESATSGGRISNVASAAVRLGTDPLFDCSDIIGKVFTDRNGNGVQDAGEAGISGVTLATVRGTLITTDAAGRYNVPCAEVPTANRGSNFILKVDERTLPIGYQMVCGNPKTVRVTPGKLAKLNFGATPFRVVRMELFDEAFEAGGTGLGTPLANALAGMPSGVLSDAPSSVLVQHMGQSPLAERRLRNVANALKDGWDREGSACYPLRVQTEIRSLPATVKGVPK